MDSDFRGYLRPSACYTCRQKNDRRRYAWQTVVITGATSGIGKVASEKLAGMGARMVLVARDKTRGEAALARLREICSGATHTIHYADLSRLVEMKRAAAAIAQAEPRIDVLINNAGALFGNRQQTEDGMELTFATNHMA